MYIIYVVVLYYGISVENNECYNYLLKKERMKVINLICDTKLKWENHVLGFLEPDQRRTLFW